MTLPLKDEEEEKHLLRINEISLINWLRGEHFYVSTMILFSYFSSSTCNFFVSFSTTYTIKSL